MVGALSHRVQRLEVLAGMGKPASEDEKVAQRLAEELGFEVEILYPPKGEGAMKVVEQRRRTAHALKQQGWSVSRIARALKTCERVVLRYLSKASQ
jgi:hypothetical protein